MKTIVLSGLCVLAALSGAHASPAYDESPWCARFSGGSDYYENCNMPDFATCLGEIRGTGGNTVCSPNPRARFTSPEPPRAHHSGKQKI